MLKLKNLGSTDIKVSPLGLGTVKIGRNQQVKYPSPFKLPNDQQVIELLSIAKDNGINLIDTAPAYGDSEERLGKLLAKQRLDWVIATKVGEEFIYGQSKFDFSASHLNNSIERSLKRLNTDYLDMVLVHSSGEDLQIIDEDEVFVTLEAIKKRGLIRAYGMSTKTIAGGIKAIELADVVMVTYNPLFTDEEQVLEHAKKLNKGVLIKKAFASGHLNKVSESDPVFTAMDFIYKQPAVTSIIVGTINPKHLLENIKVAERVISN